MKGIDPPIIGVSKLDMFLMREEVPSNEQMDDKVMDVKFES